MSYVLTLRSSKPYQGRKCNNNGLTLPNTSQQVIGNYYEQRTADVHEGQQRIKTTMNLEFSSLALIQK